MTTRFKWVEDGGDLHWNAPDGWPNAVVFWRVYPVGYGVSCSMSENGPDFTFKRVFKSKEAGVRAAEKWLSRRINQP